MNILIISVDQNETIRLIHAVEDLKHIPLHFPGVERAIGFVGNRLPVPCPIGLAIVAPSIQESDLPKVEQVLAEKKTPCWKIKGHDFNRSLSDALEWARAG